MSIHPLLNVTQIEVNKSDLSVSRSRNICMSVDDLKDGEVILQIDTFGFSANNVTYAVLGERLGYWGFFPAELGWGIVPVWGFAEVLHSAHPQINVGERVFGYLPMGTHLKITASQVNSFSFSDVSPSRASINPVYDSYVRCSADPSYRREREDWQLNFRPLFMTSFVLDNHIGKTASDQTQRILVTSASSKTAYGTAFLLKDMQAQRGQSYQIVGLTSPRNVDNCHALGCYDQIVTYDDIHTLSSDLGTLILDFAGNKDTLLSLQSQLSKNHIHTFFIGLTDVASLENSSDEQVQGEMFFAPAQVKQCISEWGQSDFSHRYALAWAHVFDKVKDVMHRVDIKGSREVETLYLQTLLGKADPTALNVLTF